MALSDEGLGVTVCATQSAAAVAAGCVVGVSRTWFKSQRHSCMVLRNWTRQLWLHLCIMPWLQGFRLCMQRAVSTVAVAVCEKKGVMCVARLVRREARERHVMFPALWQCAARCGRSCHTGRLMLRLCWLPCVTASDATSVTHRFAHTRQ